MLRTLARPRSRPGALLLGPITTYNPNSHPNPTSNLNPPTTRTFFGIGELVSVLANPAATLRQLQETRDLLSQARADAQLRAERSRIPKKHTFARLPGFHGRENEQALLRKVLAGNPQMNIVFGATSVGKTALLREVLARATPGTGVGVEKGEGGIVEKVVGKGEGEGKVEVVEEEDGEEFRVIKFDLRISGFADLRSLFVALCEQFQTFFTEMNDTEMDDVGLTFKHMLLDLEEKDSKIEIGLHETSVADLAELMETLQSALLRYWEYDPESKAAEKYEEGQDAKKTPNEKKKQPAERKVDLDQAKKSQTSASSEAEDGETKKKPFVKKPVVFFMDEAHKLPALVNDQLSLKVFLDTLLVLTKQDRLCHVILATSDSFFQHFLRSMNVGHHAQIITIGDCTKAETQSFFTENLLPTIPEELRSKIDFEEIYDAFGGKLSHISDYVSVWINTGGEISPLTSAIFTQAYTLLQFHLTHESFETFSPLTTATAWASSTPEEEKAQFTRDDLIYVMRKLTKPPYSLPYFELCRKIGTHQADAMIKTRVLDLRWTRTVSPEMDWVERVWSKDGIERPVVLPMTRIVRRAMEVALREEDERVKDGKGEEVLRRGESEKKEEERETMK